MTETPTRERRSPPDADLSSLGDLEKWPLLFHTAKRMRSAQLRGILERKLKHLVVPDIPIDFDARYADRIPENLSTRPQPVRANTDKLCQCLSPDSREIYRGHMDDARDGVLTFLNTPIEVDGGNGPDWLDPRFEEQPILWSIKFYGFDFLNWSVFEYSPSESLTDTNLLFEAWIRDWWESDETAIGTDKYLRRIWTPHAVSLRIINGSRYLPLALTRNDGSRFPQILEKILYKNALFLEQHVEHDIGGNHLIENGTALALAGLLFEGEKATQWLEVGIDILEDACDQFLADGGHFERSPMYHILSLSRYLTVLDILESSGTKPSQKLYKIATEATRFLTSIRPPDGRIPLLNDSVYNESLRLETCLDYARAVGVEPTVSTQRAALDPSGYYWLGKGKDRMLVDGGPFGPPHLPAHSHNDFFSILLWVDGVRFLTDTGTYSYASTDRRQFSRSVRGHNTVQVGAVEPTPIGGQYLAGRRVRPRVQYVKTNDVTMFDGEYHRTSMVESGYTHRRRIYADTDWWLVQDHVRNSEQRTLRSRLHFHPDTRIVSSGENTYTFESDDHQQLHLLVPGETDIKTTMSSYFPKFGVEHPRRTLVIETGPEFEESTFLLSKEFYGDEGYRQLTSSLARNDHCDIEPPYSGTG